MVRGRRSHLVPFLCAFILFCVLNLFRSYFYSGNGYKNEYSPEKSRNLPDCIIFGAKKGGTRALLEFINLHPDVEISPREVHHFNFDSQFKKGLEWYRYRLKFNEMVISF